jgi:hypothetical protein
MIELQFELTPLPIPEPMRPPVARNKLFEDPENEIFDSDEHSIPEDVSLLDSRTLDPSNDISIELLIARNG